MNLLKNDLSLYEIKNYGRIETKLAALLEERNMTRNQLARAVGSRFEVIDRWTNRPLEKIDGDLLARICCFLECEVADILEYKR